MKTFQLLLCLLMSGTLAYGQNTMLGTVLAQAVPIAFILAPSPEKLARAAIMPSLASILDTLTLPEATTRLSA